MSAKTTNRKELNPLALVSAKDRQVGAFLGLAGSEKAGSLRACELDVLEGAVRLDDRKEVSPIPTQSKKKNRTLLPG